MEARASFADLCAHSFVWWLLTNALGAALVFVRFLLLTSGVAHDAGRDVIGLVLATYLIPWLIATYLTLLWPVFALLPQWWALAARQPQARRGRMLLVVVAPFTLLITLQPHDGLLTLKLSYLLASIISAAWMFRRWLW